MGCHTGYQGCHGKRIGSIRNLCAVVSSDFSGTVEALWKGSHY